jgi:hypothetical protein
MDMIEKVIIQNQVQCNKCGDEPYSAFRHDFKYCKCGAVAVDGGMAYLRRVGAVRAMTDLSMTMDNEDLTKCVDAVKNMKETGRNDFGIALGVIRALRDGGYLNMEKFK